MRCRRNTIKVWRWWSRFRRSNRKRGKSGVSRLGSFRRI